MKFERAQFIEKFIAETRDNLQVINEGLLQMENNPSPQEIQRELMRRLHTVKGSAKMLNITPIAQLAHAMEEALQHISRQSETASSDMIDALLQGADLLKALMEALPKGEENSLPTVAAIERLNRISGSPIYGISSELSVRSESATPLKETPAAKKEKSIVFDKSAFIKRFLTEMSEHLRSMEQACERLEVNREDSTAQEQGFRAAHTLKGSARMLKFESISNISQRIETLYRAAWEKKNPWTTYTNEIVINTLALLRQLQEQIETDGQEDFKQASVLDLLDQAIAGQTIDPNAIRHSFTTTKSVLAAEALPEVPETETADTLGERLVQARLITREQLLHVNQNSDNRIPLGERLIAFGFITREQLNQALKEQRTSRELLGHTAIRQAGAYETEVPPVPAPSKAGDEPITLRIRLEKLDRLIKTVGELITEQMQAQQNIPTLRKILSDFRRLIRSLQDNLYRHQRESASAMIDPHEEEIIQSAQQILDAMESFSKLHRDSLANFDLLINDMQNSVMTMRMIALSTIFDAYPRAVRDLAKNLGKEIELLIEGRETELDRKMVEKLNEPLIHLIRNAIDHGIEPPEVRRRLGKPEKGLLKIAARNEGTSIAIEIADDGHGIDFEKIRRKALAKGLIQHESDFQRMSENDIINLIFLPGFSTADFITDISGRGYGMDVVKQGVENLKGYLSVYTKPGRGTVFTVHLPLTLTSLRAMFVRAGIAQLAFPIASVSETLKIQKTELIEVVRKKAIRLRNQLIPVIQLNDILQISPGETADADEYFVIIAHANGERAGFIVDDIVDEKEIIVKPIPKHFHRLKLISSATIAGHNEVIFVLHVPHLIESIKEAPITERPKAERKTAQSILVVDDSLNTREVEKTILQAYGYEVDTAKDGLEALDKMKRRAYDLIVTDLEMPVMDGFTLTSRIREEKDFRQIPVVIVTSRDSAEDKRRGIEVGANAYIVKGSFDQTNLIDTVESLIG